MKFSDKIRSKPLCTTSLQMDLLEEKVVSLMSLQVQALLVFVVIAAVAAHAAHRDARSPGT